MLLSGDTKQVLHCWRLLESSEHHPQDKQENHPTQETAGGLDSHPSGPSIQGTFLLEKESIAKNSHPTHVNSYFLFFFFFTVNSFLLFFPCTVARDGEKQFRALTWFMPLLSQQHFFRKQGCTRSRQLAHGWEQRSESSCSETQLEHTHKALVNFESVFKLNKLCKGLHVEQKHINEAVRGIQ